MDRLTYIGHATTLIRLEGTTVLTDPILRAGAGSPPASGPAAAARAVEAPGRRPHLAPAPRPPGHPLPAAGPLEDAARGPAWRFAIGGEGGAATRSCELGRGETISVGEAEVTAVPAEHGGRRGRWGSEIEPLGYVIRSEGRSVLLRGRHGPVRGDVGDRAGRRRAAAGLGLGALRGRGPPRPGDGGTSPDAGSAARRRPDPLGNLLSRRRQAVAPEPLAEPPREFARLARRAGVRGRGEGPAARLRDVVGELMRGSHRIRRGIGRARPRPPALAADRACLLGGDRTAARHRRPQLRRRAGHHRADRDPPRPAVAAADPAAPAPDRPDLRPRLAGPERGAGLGLDRPR